MDTATKAAVRVSKLVVILPFPNTVESCRDIWVYNLIYNQLQQWECLTSRGIPFQSGTVTQSFMTIAECSYKRRVHEACANLKFSKTWPYLKEAENKSLFMSGIARTHSKHQRDI